MTVPGEIQVVDGYFSFILFCFISIDLCIGKSILMSSVAPFKGIRIPESREISESEIQNPRLSYIPLR